MFRFLRSEKGFTVVELAAVLVVLGILTAVAVPLFAVGLKSQKRKDCRSQALIIETAVQQVMYGMVDNGKKQESLKDENDNIIRCALDFNNSKIQGDHKATYPAVAVKDEDGIGVEDDKYIGKPCFVLCESQQIPGKVAFTIGDIRGGYRDVANVPDYKDGCANGNYLKKEALKDKPFYEILDNQEIPVCPFADYDNTPTDDDYYYHILWDTETDSIKVLCSCPECNVTD